MKLYKQYIAILLVTVVAVAAGINMVRRAGITASRSSDFRVFMAAAEESLHGGEKLYTFTDSQGLHYIYPPTFAVLMTPLSVLPRNVASTAWYLFNIFLLGASLILIVRMLTPEGREKEWGILLFPLIITAESTLATLTRGQVGILMLASCVFALYYHRQGKPFVAGILVAFATILKIYTGLLIFYFLVRRDWRALAGSAVGAVVFGIGIPASMLGFKLTLDHWRVWITTIVLPFLSSKPEETPLFGELQDLDIMRNQSMLATLKHFGNIAGVPESAIVWIKVAALAFGVAMLIFLMLAWRRVESKRNIYRVPMEWSLALLAGLMLIPVSWIHYYCLMILPLAIVSSYLYHGAHGRGWRVLRLCAVILGTLCAVSIALTAIDGPLQGTPLYEVVIVERSIGLAFWSALVTSVAFFYLLDWRVRLTIRRQAGN